MKIGVLSDTHGDLPASYEKFLRECDEIWHAGDIGSLEIINELEKLCRVRAVFGNIDGQDLRSRFPEEQLFTIGDLKIYMIHIGGYPGRYSSKSRLTIDREKPDIFISGHSHILKVMRDKKRGLLHINPGAAGLQGLHQKRTMARFVIENKEIRDLEIFEAPRWG